MDSLRVDWPTFKNFVSTRSLSTQWVNINNFYYLYAIDGPFSLQCTIAADGSQLNDQNDFETNYKSNGNTSFSDIDGTPMQRFKASKKGWTYGAIPFEFSTSRLRSGNSTASDDLFSQDLDGNDRTWITCKIYDNSGNEITTPGTLGANYNNAVKTVIDFEPTYDYEVIGGSIRTTSTINTDVRMWVIGVPDIAAPTGSKEMAGGVNLNFLAANNEYSVDGRVTKYMTYNPTYHTSKVRVILKYAAGTNVRLSVVIETYRS